jgi:hypothetical protein
MVNFTQNLPATINVNAGTNGTVSIAYDITGAPTNEAVVLWYFNGQVIANNVTSTSSSNSYTSGALNVPIHDNGQLYAVVNIGGINFTSVVATVEITPSETDAPTITSVVGVEGGTNIVVTFNERLFAGTATNMANFSVSGRTITAISFNNTSNQVTLTLDSPLASGTYTVSATGISDFPNGNIGDSQGVLNLGAAAPELGSPVKTDTAFSFSFPTQTGVRYQVQYTEDLGTGWTDLEEIVGDGTTKTVTDAAPSPNQRFYRVIIRGDIPAGTQ